MTRVRISAGVLLLLVLASAFMSSWVNRRCDEMLFDINRLSIAAENGECEILADGTDELNRKWERFRDKASVLLKYDKLVEADRISARIVRLADNDSEELKAGLAELRELLEMLKSGETPSLTSIF
ncbi:MAG: DUF4363 family protein [Ruminococcus sp.]|uniref:DUF4363 family protein n=1 Tax=Ruminococcus sp. TaxID=41978 RepID=UPI001B7730DC|nr:DUF4363 family protein [Ruminococcus sp.]MBP5578619.1 DUF4363 family protein [Ruminococcus sp.]